MPDPIRPPAVEVAPPVPPSPPSPAVPPAPPADDWPNRVLALVPLVALALLWSNHHLGLAAGQPALLAAVAAVLPLALALVGQLLDKSQQANVESRLRGLIARLLSWRALAVLYLALGVVTLTWSSVLVLADDGARVPAARLQALDQAGAPLRALRVPDGGGPARRVVATGPFGRPFRLEVDGYAARTVEVYPLLGLRVRPARDLLRAPAVLLRFSELALGSWQDAGGAELRLVALAPGQPETLLLSTRAATGALLVGRAQPVPAAWAADWRTEMLAARITDETIVARHLVAWRRPQSLRPRVELQPGMALRATLTNAQGRLVARATFVLGQDELQDQGMEDVE